MSKASALGMKIYKRYRFPPEIIQHAKVYSKGAGYIKR